MTDPDAVAPADAVDLVLAAPPSELQAPSATAVDKTRATAMSRVRAGTGVHRSSSLQAVQR